VLFQQCLVDVFGFLKKLFFSNNAPWPLSVRSLRTSALFYRFFRKTSGSFFEKTGTNDSYGEKNSKNWNQPPLAGY